VPVIASDSGTNRRRVQAHRAMLRAAFPADGRDRRLTAEPDAADPGPVVLAKCPWEERKRRSDADSAGFTPIPDRGVSVGAANEAAGSAIRGD
jgi:hypothetical protein